MYKLQNDLWTHGSGQSTEQRKNTTDLEKGFSVNCISTGKEQANGNISVLKIAKFEQIKGSVPCKSLTYQPNKAAVQSRT